MDHKEPGSSRNYQTSPKNLLVNNVKQQLSNVHQGFSSFLDQISTKDAMSLINELCHMHKIRPEYELTDVQGPENAKLFTVYLKLGESEKHNGKGSSIKRAQHDAAKNALQNTRLRFPVSNSKHYKRKSNHGNLRNNHSKSNGPGEKPVNELNNLLMKKRIQPKYELNVVSNEHQIQPIAQTVQNVPLASVPMNITAPLAPTMPYQTCCCGSILPWSNVQYYNIPASITYFYPNYYFDPFTKKHYMIYELINPGYINIPAISNYSTTIDNDKTQIKLEVSEKQLNEELFSANVEFEGEKFVGYGKTAQQARHMAATKALDYLKDYVFKSMTVTPTTEPLNTKDSISHLNTIASRNRFKVNYELVNSHGPVHLPVFVFKCTLYENSKPLLQSEGKEHSKKLAKRMAAKNMLIKIENGGLKDLNIVPKSLEKSSNEAPIGVQEATSNEILDCVSNKSLTFLYDLARNMSIQNPSFYYKVLKNNDPVAKCFFGIVQCEPCHVYRIECHLFFDQVNMERKFHCNIRTVGFSSTQRIAKQISAFICLLKMGLKPPRFEHIDELFIHSLRFSLKENQNFSDKINTKIKSFEEKRDLNIFCGNISDENLNQNLEFQTNYQFVLFALKKFYYYNLKDSANKSIEIIGDKIRYLIPNFKKNHNVESINHFGEQSIQNLISNLNTSKYWDHLQLLSKLLIIGTKLDPVIEFNYEYCASDNNNEIICFVSVQFQSNWLTKENFALINKHFVTYGFGINKDEAREAASLRTLLKLASNSFKHFVEKQKVNPKQFEHVEDEENQEEMNKGEKSRPSMNQVKSKQCLTLVYQTCKDIFIRKPDFIYHKWQHSNEELLCTRLIICFKQDHNQLSTKLTIIGIGTSKRLSRTIAAYILLSMLNISKLTISMLDVFQVPDFDKYLQYSINQNENCEHCLTMRPNIKNINYNEQQTFEILRNIEFVQFLLKEVYQSFMKNQKRTDPSCLFLRIKDKIFDYYNHRKQIMDQSDLFDRSTEEIQQWIQDLMEKFIPSQYWHHLQLISTIGSTLYFDLNQTLDPPVFNFKCQFIQTNFMDSETQQDSDTKGSIAVITLHCSSTAFQEQCALLQKEVLSFAMDHDQHEARELASYKTLRYLAINIWKTVTE